MSHASQRARIHLHRGNLTQARHWYGEAVQEARNNETGQALTTALGNLGNVCAQLGEYAEAEACYHEVLTLQRREHDPSIVGETLVNLGNLKADTGQFETAKAYYLEALDVLHPIEHHRALGILYNNLALMELATKQPDAAISHFQRALECHRVVGDESGLANTFSQFGKALLSQGDLQQAERCLNNASEHFIKLGQEPGEAAVLRSWPIFTQPEATTCPRCAAWNGPSRLTGGITCRKSRTIKNASPSSTPGEKRLGLVHATTCDVQKSRAS